MERFSGRNKLSRKAWSHLQKLGNSTVIMNQKPYVYPNKTDKRIVTISKAVSPLTRNIQERQIVNSSNLKITAAHHDSSKPFSLEKVEEAITS